MNQGCDLVFDFKIVLVPYHSRLVFAICDFYVELYPICFFQIRPTPDLVGFVSVNPAEAGAEAGFVTV